METPLYNSTVRHSVYIERYKARVAREVIRLVSALSADLYQRIAASELENMTRRDLDALLVEVRRSIADGYEPVTSRIEDALKEFAVYEAGWQARAAQASIGVGLAVPSDADLWAAMYSRPFQGKLLKEWLKDLPGNTSARVRQTIRQGYVDGLGSIEIARQIRGTRTRPGIMDVSARGSEALVRTATAHTASAARAKTYEANDAIEFEQWASVLDGRTSAICRGRDGAIYKKGVGPRPPAHINCRSTMLPVTDGNAAALKTRPTYNDWLKQQPENVQDDILGPKRGKLFRDGSYTVDRFTDKSGQEYTLDQLKAKDAEAWSEAFGE